MVRVWLYIGRGAGVVAGAGALALSKAPRARTAMIMAGLALALLAVPSALAQPNIEGEAVVLAAVPEFQDPLWRRTVLLAAPMSFGGHVGLILNRPTRLSLSTVLPQHASSKKVVDPVYFGGPFSAVTIVAVLPRAEASGAGAVRLGEELTLVHDAKLIHRIIEQTPNDARYFAGLVLWLPGELRAEIDRGLWTLHQADATTVLRKDTDRLWPELAYAARKHSVRAPAIEPRESGSSSQQPDVVERAADAFHGVIELCAADDERRRKAQHGGVRVFGQDTVPQHRFAHAARAHYGSIEFDAYKKSFAAHRAYERTAQLP